MFESDDQRCRNLITNELISGTVYLETLNGNPKLEFNFKDGRRDGIQLTWFKNGELNSEYNYVNGIEHGYRKAWYENGNIHFIESFNNGREHGTFKNWHENSRLKWHREYFEGEEHGLWRSWYKNGQQESEAYYNNGELNKAKRWNNLGLLVYVTEYKNGILFLETCWDDSGEKIECN
jgi:antitoxin component YwqK of YwqJK toxin-antitoxin module